MNLSEKEADKMMEETEKENPGNRDPHDIALKERFEDLGLVKADEILLQKFRFASNPDTSFLNSQNSEIRIRFVRDSITGRNNRLIVFQGSDSSETRTDPYMDLKYAFVDVIPGGNKEIVMMIEGYVSNNELYDFEVYEIK